MRTVEYKYTTLVIKLKCNHTKMPDTFIQNAEAIINVSIKLPMENV